MNQREQHPTGWLLLVLVIIAAAIIYHPYQLLPLDVWDFREFIPILKVAGNPWQQLGALLAYYAHHGRMNPLFYATFVDEYDWFGTHAIGWQWLRFGWMTVDLVLVVLIARRLGIRLAVGVAAAAVLVVATPAVRAWVQLMAEPQALAAILGATWLAVGYAKTAAWPRSAASISLLGTVRLPLQGSDRLAGSRRVAHSVCHQRTAIRQLDS